jgi:UDP-MurNAc hydroxylase
MLNETDCKLGYADLRSIGEKGIDIGFYMFSGANWFPMMYDYSEAIQKDLVRARRRSLLKSFIQRIKLTRPRLAVPAAGPCTVLDPDLLWLNSDERGIFIDPQEAIGALSKANLGVEPLYMAATDAWSSCSGIKRCAPEVFRAPRRDYVRAASERTASKIRHDQAMEPPAGDDLPERLVNHFNALVSAQTEAIRKRVNAKLALVITGRRSGAWTVDFTAKAPEYVREGLAADWTYKIEAEDKLLYPFLTGQRQFFEHLLLSLRVRLARRPDEYNEPLYHFLYDPDPERLHNWYASH